jgi:hypothetical protein
MPPIAVATMLNKARVCIFMGGPYRGVATSTSVASSAAASRASSP